MTLQERVSYLDKLFMGLEKTSSRNEKESMLQEARQLDTQLADDLTYALEILDGRHKLGYTYYPISSVTVAGASQKSLREYLDPLFEPKRLNRFDEETVRTACRKASYFPAFTDELVNRKFRLGIGKSQLAKNELSPMLAKKYDADKLPKSHHGYYVTEKLDGNRCLAKYDFDGQQWTFWSRSGKEMRVNFNMCNLPTCHIYDGEVLSDRQLSEDRGQAAFNELSGAINSKYGNKSDLVYMIFDIPSLGEQEYDHRRAALDLFSAELAQYVATSIERKNVYILPTLAHYMSKQALEEELAEKLHEVTSADGEGLMINVGDRPYEHKRTDALLKVKEVYTMDMRVTELNEGTGKHAGKVGALQCYCKDKATGKVYMCNVGSGLSDYQRMHWANNPDEIIGKIVEVAYFSVSQDAAMRGSSIYALRFPRLKRVRDDKRTTSVD